MEKKPDGLTYQSSVSQSEDRLLDCMNIGLVDMEVFTALRTDEPTHPSMSFGYERQVGEQCYCLPNIIKAGLSLDQALGPLES